MNPGMSGALQRPKGDRLSVPSTGRTIFSSVRPWVQPISVAFGMLSRNLLASGQHVPLWHRYGETFSPLIPSFDTKSFSPETELRLCISAVLCEYMLYRAANPQDKTVTFEDAEQWFLGDVKEGDPGLVIGNRWITSECTRALRDLSFNADFLDLMPYILEWFDNFTLYGDIPDKGHIRAMKRSLGVVCTPSDLADYMVGQAFKLHSAIAPDPHQVENKFAVLDPACGTGVFLSAALDIMKATWGKQCKTWDLVKCLYGMDVSPQAIQSCTFVLTARCFSESRRDNLSPWKIWQAIRGNLAVVDSTLVYRDQTGRNQPFSLARLRAATCDELLTLRQSRDSAIRREKPLINWPRDTRCNLSYNPTNQGPSKLEDIFPELSTGFTVVVGNPPYSRLPWDSFTGVRAAHFRTAPSSTRMKSSNCYPLFVEMMWQLTRQGSASAAMVVPLSIAYGSSPSIRHLRAAIEEVPGTWRFSFFDRTPDSLFGDDVKTRNAVVLWNRDSNVKSSCVLTGPLMRWNSRNRNALFERINFVPIAGNSIRDFIPKFGSSLEATTYYHIHEVKRKLLPQFIETHVKECEPEFEHKRSVFYSSVAYNWIPVFRTLPSSIDHGIREERRSIKTLCCREEQDAWFVFACLVSRLTYWLWRVEGDGFHVTKEFLDRLPFHPSALSEDCSKQLVLLAERMWSRMQEYPVESVNKGKRTLSYCPYSCESELNEIDAILLGGLGLSENYSLFLSEFVRDNMVAGRHEEIRINPALRRVLSKESQHD